MGQDRLSPAPVSIGPSVTTAGAIHFVTAAIVRIPSTPSPWRSSVAAAAATTTTVVPATHSLSVLTFLHRSATLACPSLFSCLPQHPIEHALRLAFLYDFGLREL